MSHQKVGRESSRHRYALLGALATSTVVALTTGAAPAAASTFHLGDRVLKRGMSGPDVRSLQKLLTEAGYATPATGNFGSITQANLVRFERRFHLGTGRTVTVKIVRDLRIVAALEHRAASQRTKGKSTAGSSQSTGGTTASRKGAAKSSPTADTARSGGAGISQGSQFGPSGPSNEAPTGKGKLNGDGTATPPANAPAVIQRIFAAANHIANDPYIYGGGHGSFNDSGYDCSGSVSYALHGGHLLSQPEDSSELESYGSPGPGRWITIYANAGHAWMTIAGLRFDTAAQGSTGGSRWTDQRGSTSGFVVVHPTGW